MAVATENLVSFQMFASFGGDFKPSALPPLCFLHWSNRRRRKRIHTSLLFERVGKFSRWCGLPHIMGWVGFSELITGLITAASVC